MLIPNLTTYQAYERTDNQYDLTNLQTLLPDLPAPKIDMTVLHRFIDYGEQDKWGKAKKPAATVDFNVAAFLNASTASADGDTTVFGLDIAGPGGGQWTITATGGQLTNVERGLPNSDEVAVVHLPVTEFAKLADGEGVDEILALAGAAAVRSA